MIDTYDKRILRTYLDEYFGDFLFDSSKPFSFYDGKSIYAVPLVVTDDIEFLGKYASFEENYGFIPE